jgi:gamma-glutamyl hydrolase
VRPRAAGGRRGRRQHAMMLPPLQIFLLGTAAVADALPLTGKPSKPVIGIYPQVSASYLTAYKEWVTQEGAAWVVLPESFGAEQMEKIFLSTNGFLIPGGDAGLSKSARALIQRAIQANQAGDYYPVWGTCDGFEWLMEIFGGMGDIVPGFDSEYMPAKLTFTPAAKTSRLYRGANATLLNWLATEPITYNAHHEGITPKSAASNKGLAQSIDVLSTSVDRKGKAFVAQFEAKTLPIYGNQFHPEKIQFVHSSSDPHIPRTAEAVAAARYLAQFFVSEAKKSNHTGYS